MTVRQTILFRRIRRFVAMALILLCVLDYARVFGYQGDDWRRFDGATVNVDQIIDHRTFRSGDTTIRLIGVAEKPSDGGAFLRASLVGHPIRLALDQPQTRDQDNRLLAICYLSASDCVNVDCIAAGAGDIDMSFPSSIQAELQLAVAKSRRAAARRWRKLPKDPNLELLHDN